MSISKKQEVNCPNCDSPIPFTFWQSINTMIPNAITDIISGKLFNIQCEKCGYKTRVDYPILFNDMVHKVMIYYIHPDQMEETMKAAEVLKITGAKVRIVLSQNELREKTLIFNSGFDDRIIEIIKIITLGQLGDQLNGRNVDAVYFDYHDDNYFFDLILDGQPASININIDAIKAYSESISNVLSDKPQEYVIDQNWALQYIDSLSES